MTRQSRYLVSRLGAVLELKLSENWCVLPAKQVGGKFANRFLDGIYS